MGKHKSNQYLVACVRSLPVRNIFLVEASFAGEGQPSSAMQLTLDCTPSFGDLVICNQLMHLTEQSRKYAEIFALPRRQWITLPDLPVLDQDEEEKIFGEALIDAHVLFADVADFSVSAEEVEIVPHNPRFTSAWLRNWAKAVDEVALIYNKKRSELIGLRDPYRILRR